MKIVPIVVLFIFGIIWGLSLEKIGLIPIFLILGIIFCLIILKKQLSKYEVLNVDKIISCKTILFISLIITLGLLLTRFRLYDYNNYFSEEDINITGEIADLLSNGDYYNKFLLISNKKKILVYIPNELDIKINDKIELVRFF